MPQEITSRERTGGILNSQEENLEIRGKAHDDRVRSETLQVLLGIMSQERTEGIMNTQSENLNFMQSRSARNDSVSSKTSQMHQEIFSQERTEGLLDNLGEKFNSRGSAHNDRVSDITSQVPQEIMSHERTEGIMDCLRENSKLRGSAHNDRAMEVNLVPGSCSFSHDKYRNQNAGVEKEYILVSKPGSQATNAAENLVRVHSHDQKSGVIPEVGSQRQLLSSRTSPPDWTVEQLDLLMVDD